MLNRQCVAVLIPFFLNQQVQHKNAYGGSWRYALDIVAHCDTVAISTRALASWCFAALAALVAVALSLGLGVGALPIAPDHALAVLASHLLPGVSIPVDPTLDAVIWQIRVPRTLLGLAVGASLATAGALFQGMFRNPLADPGLLGITLGAAASVSLSIVLAGTLGVVLGGAVLWLAPFRPYFVPLAAFIGSLVTTGIVVVFAGYQHRGRGWPQGDLRFGNRLSAAQVCPRPQGPPARCVVGLHDVKAFGLNTALLQEFLVNH